jgi:RimJ/RimL family protein N-acetyltransferase
MEGSMGYRIIPHSAYHSNGYEICAIREQDIYDIKNWRNDQMDVLRQTRKLTDEDQVRYYRTHVIPTFQEYQPDKILFSFCFDQQCIGYGGLTNIDWSSHRAEVSFLMDTKRVGDHLQYSIDFGTFLQLLQQVSLRDLCFNRLFTETYDIRPWHIQVLEENNFRYEGRLLQHVKIGDQYIDSILHGCLKEYCDV